MALLLEGFLLFGVHGPSSIQFTLFIFGDARDLSQLVIDQLIAFVPNFIFRFCFWRYEDIWVCVHLTMLLIIIQLYQILSGVQNVWVIGRFMLCWSVKFDYTVLCSFSTSDCVEIIIFHDNLVRIRSNESLWRHYVHRGRLHNIICCAILRINGRTSPPQLVLDFMDI